MFLVETGESRSRAETRRRCSCGPKIPRKKGTRTGASPNTVHLSILTVPGPLLPDGVLHRVLVGKLLILRLTQRGFRRPRLDTTRSCRISASTALCIAARRRGGKGPGPRYSSSQHAHGVHE